jgi:iron complex outermembrane receptor protein
VDVGLDREWHLGGANATGLLRRLRASLALDNVADAAVYDQCGLPQPGRTLRFGVTLR